MAAVAADIGISINTLRKHFAADLVNDRAETVTGELDFTQPAPASAAVPPSPPGRPEFEPTYRQREEVRLFKADNWSDERIATYLGIARATLLKHFADELEYGVSQVRARVLRNLMRQSDEGSVSASDRILKLPGMIGPPERLPTPSSEPEPERVGKKEQALRDAQTAHEGTTWDRVLKH